MQIPDSLDAPRKHPMPIVPPELIAGGRISKAQPIPELPSSGPKNMAVSTSPHSSDVPITAPATSSSSDLFGIHFNATGHDSGQEALAQSALVDIPRLHAVNVNDIPQVQLPAGWDAPLANPVPQVPPMQPYRQRGRQRGALGRVVDPGPLHSGGNAASAFHVFHIGDTAYNEWPTNSDYLVDRQAYLLAQIQRRQQEMVEYEKQVQVLRMQEEWGRNASNSNSETSGDC